MSRIKELKQNPDNNISMVDVFKIFCPDGKTKYIEFLLRLSKSTKHLEQYVNEIRDNFKREFGITDDDLKHLTPFQLYISYRFVEMNFNLSDLKTFQKFCDYNERGLIDNNDLSKFTNFEDVMTATSLAEIKVFEKDLEKQVKTIYTSDEWIVLRPLTFYSSKKYGSSTKWCTTSENNPDYFSRYSKKGILIYTINKLTGLKVGTFKSLDKNDPEFSFWNQVDSRIDSMESNLPDNILNVIKNEINNNPVTNYSLLSDKDRIKEDMLLNEITKLRVVEEDMPIAEVRNYENDAIQQENYMIEEERGNTTMETEMFESVNREVMSEIVSAVREHFNGSQEILESAETNRGSYDDGGGCVA